MSENRYVLCRPDAGLNDMLNQIELAHRYATQTDRILIVDTAYQNAFCFLDHFSNYFQTRQTNLILDAREITPFLDKMTVFPEHLTGRVNTYRPRPNPEAENLLDAETGGALTFDMRYRYDQQLLVHHSFGGPDLALFCLTKLKIAGEIVDALLERVNAIGAPFSGVHIRNTDIKSNFAPAMQRIKGIAIRPIFVATDSLICREFCIELFGKDDVVYFSTLPDDNKPLHYLNQYIPTRQRNLDAILDLLTLSLSTQFHRVSLDGSETGAARGFTTLAEHLVNHDGIVLSLLGVSEKSVSLLKRAMEWRQALA